MNDLKSYKTSSAEKDKVIFKRNNYGILIAVAISVLTGSISLFSSIVENNVLLVVLGIVLAAIVIYFFNPKSEIKRNI